MTGAEMGSYPKERLYPGTRMRPRLSLQMRVVVTDSGDSDSCWMFYSISSSTEADADEGDIDLGSCLEYECKHDLDDVDRPRRLNGRRAVMFTISYIYERR